MADDKKDLTKIPNDEAIKQFARSRLEPYDFESSLRDPKYAREFELQDKISRLEEKLFHWRLIVVFLILLIGAIIFEQWWFPDPETKRKILTKPEWSAQP